MRIRTTFIWLALAAVTVLTGCATPPQERVNLAADYFQTGSKRIGIVMSEVPKPDTFFPGADCLLCLATASLANRSMTNAVQAWPTDELTPLKQEIHALLTAQGQQALVIDEPIKIQDLPDRKNAEPGFARKDFSALQQRTGVDRLLVIHVSQLGAQRNYSAYIPNGPALAKLTAQAYLVDLPSHRLAWYDTVDFMRVPDGEWDEAPRFPGLTNTFFQVLEEGKDQIKKPFVRP